MAITDAQVKAALDTYNKHPRTYFDSEGWLRKVPDEVIMRRTIEAADAAAWRPIEEAPKGKRIFVKNKSNQSLASWSWIYEGWLDTIDQCLLDWEPTHFRPLPEPTK